MNNTEIHWKQAQDFPEKKNEQAKYLNEFRTSFCDMFDISDWIYYSDKTGWSIEKLRSYAKYDKTPSFLEVSLYNMIGSELSKDDLLTLKL